MGIDREIAISLKNVSKCFKRYEHPGDRLKELLFPGKSRSQEFWALRDINLEVRKGETLGIVGRNGSGKSTLLQIIAGTLTPTTGEVKVNGRISALLELGSGFNPEFTGRQNVFFNGKLLGLKQEEIEAKFDDIAAFADIGDFLEQPVKTYSSGMFVRLAFAVAINADPDILIVDEALAVGDEAFQRKCFSRIHAFQEQGKTILFVSHAASSVVELCNWSILIERGELLLAGSPKLVISNYHKLIYAPVDKIENLRQEIRYTNHEFNQSLTKSFLVREINLKVREKERNKSEAFYDPNLKPKSTISYISRGAEITNAYLTTPNGKTVNVLVKGEDYVYNYSVNFTKVAYRVRFGMLIKTISGFELGGAGSHILDNAIDYIPAESLIKVEFKFRCSLLPGVYFLNNGVLGIVDEAEVYLHRCIDAVMFRVQSEETILETSIVDFQIEPKISIIGQQLRV